jgi:hypothetical protein
LSLVQHHSAAFVVVFLLHQVEAGWGTLVMLQACGSSDGGVTSSPVQILDCSQLDIHFLMMQRHQTVEQSAAAQVEAIWAMIGRRN